MGRGETRLLCGSLLDEGVLGKLRPVEALRGTLAQEALQEASKSRAARREGRRGREKREEGQKGEGGGEE